MSGDEDEIIPFSNLRRLTAEHMVRSKATSPHVLQAVEADFARVARARESVSNAWKKREGFSLTWLPFIAKAVCEAIREFPRVNGAINGENLIVYRRVNLAIAVDLDFDGLVAPVIRDADQMSLQELARAIRDISDRARGNSLTPEDFTGGTYTISNSGVFGTMITAPIINQPQVAILSTDGITKKPVVIETEDGDNIGIRPVGVLAQSFDHRAIDGAYSAAFLNRVREIIQTKDWAAVLA
jgi:2-oxoglutarate dehydrogenase E2 component (dihydrolipoamide succinyltransferase)